MTENLSALSSHTADPEGQPDDASKEQSDSEEVNKCRSVPGSTTQNGDMKRESPLETQDLTSVQGYLCA